MAFDTHKQPHRADEKAAKYICEIVHAEVEATEPYREDDHRCDSDNDMSPQRIRLDASPEERHDAESDDGCHRVPHGPVAD